jgi:hypothetical protein
MVYLDNILICSETVERKQKNGKNKVKALFSNGLRTKRKKCEFFKKELDCLGYRIVKGAVELSNGQL